MPSPPRIPCLCQHTLRHTHSPTQAPVLRGHRADAAFPFFLWARNREVQGEGTLTLLSRRNPNFPGPMEGFSQRALLHMRDPFPRAMPSMPRPMLWSPASPIPGKRGGEGGWGGSMMGTCNLWTGHCPGGNSRQKLQRCPAFPGHLHGSPTAREKLWVLPTSPADTSFLSTGGSCSSWRQPCFAGWEAPSPSLRSSLGR